MSQFAVSANDIDVSGLSLDVTLPVDWLTSELSDADVTPVAPGHLTTRLSRSGGDVVVRGRIKAAVSTPCARCLHPASVEVDAELALLLRPAGQLEFSGHGRDQNGAEKKGGKPREPEYEFTAEEAELDTYDGETVVLDPFIREAILLEMPNFPLCSDSCPGIGPAASEGDRDGAPPAHDEDAQDASTRGLDPRLAPLSALREKLGKKLTGEGDRGSRPAPRRPANPGTSKKKKKE